jgi:predicted cytidylate kinase
MIITISGLPGSGKTTVGRIIAKKLGYKFYSIGDLRGRMAMERGLTIDQLNELGMKEAWTDKEVDAYQEELGKKEDNFVIESRLGFYFIPESVKIFLGVDLKKAAERVFRDQRPDEKTKASVAETLESMKKRIQSDKMRYRKYYGIADFMDRAHYDIVIDTTGLTIKEVVDKIMMKLSEREK